MLLFPATRGVTTITTTSQKALRQQEPKDSQPGILRFIDTYNALTNLAIRATTVRVARRRVHHALLTGAVEVIGAAAVGPAGTESGVLAAGEFLEGGGSSSSGHGDAGEGGDEKGGETHFSGVCCGKEV